MTVVTESSRVARDPSRALLVLLVVVWAASWPLSKIGVSGVPPLWYAEYRYVFAAPCMFAFVALRGQLRLPARNDWRLVLVSGGLQMAAYSALTCVALTILPPGRASVLAFSTPLWVVPLSAGFLRERPTRRALCGVAMGLLGAGVIAAPSLGAAKMTQLLAYAMLFAAAGAWGASIVYVRLHRFCAPPLQLAPWQILVAAALLLPLAAIIEGGPTSIRPRAVATLLYVGPVATAFAYWAVVEAGRRLEPRTISMALLATPPLGILFSAAIFHETLDASVICGTLLITAGILLTSRRIGHVTPGTVHPGRR